MLLRSCSPSCGPSDTGQASFLTPAFIIFSSKYSLPSAWSQPAESQWIYAKPSFPREDPAWGWEPVFNTLGSDGLSQHLHPFLGRHRQRCLSCGSGRDAALISSFHRRLPRSVVSRAAVLVCPGTIGGELVKNKTLCSSSLKMNDPCPRPLLPVIQLGLPWEIWAKFWGAGG